MIFLKLTALVTFCYLISKGITIRAEKKLKEYEKQLKDVKDAAKEAYCLMQAEKTILINTINELRNELKNERFNEHW